MAANSSSADETADITTCSICLGTFTEPKALPCIHTFCLRCLVSYCASKKQEQEVPCPLCSKAFIIPTSGIQNLPNNFFIHQLLNLAKSSGNIGIQKSVKPLPCELCSDSDAEIPSTSYCVDCDQNICDRCSKIHKKASVSKSHQVVSQGDLSTPQKRVSVSGSYCVQHPCVQSRLYCCDCKVNICPLCLSMHSQHKISEVSEAFELFRHQLSEEINTLSTCVTKQQACRKQLELDTETFLNEVSSTEWKILEKCDQLVTLIQSHQKELIEELCQFKVKILKEVATKQEGMKRQSMITENVKADCVKVWSKGAVDDVSREARDLHVRAEELAKFEDDPVFRKLSGANVLLKPSLSTMDSVKNFTGELILGDEAGTTKDDQFREQMDVEVRAPTNLTEFLKNPAVLHIMPGIKESVEGITVLGNELFLVRDTSVVYVYKTDDFSWIRDIAINGSGQLTRVIGCPHYNCLYCCEWAGDNFIFRYDLGNKFGSNWFVAEGCSELSLAKCHNVLVINESDPKRIQEYSTDGILVKEIILDAVLGNPGYFVQLSTGNIAIFNGGEQQRVCVVDSAGRIIHTYFGSPELGAEDVNHPLTLTVDTDDNVLVVFFYANNCRVELLSSTLTYLGDIAIPKHTFCCPYATYFDAPNRRLYIGERDRYFRDDGEPLTESNRMLVLGV